MGRVNVGGACRASMQILISVALVFGSFSIKELCASQFRLALPPFLLFFPAILIPAAYFGVWNGVIATTLSTLLAAIWIFPPIGQLAVKNSSDVIALSLFWGAGTLLSFGVRRYRERGHKLGVLEKERALEESRMQLHAALGSMIDAVMIINSEGEIVHFNEAFATFHRFENKDDCPTRVEDYVALFEISLPDGSSIDPDEWPLSRALKGETIIDCEYVLRRTDTGEIWVGSYNFSPIRGRNGEVVGAVAIARDVTEFRRSLDALRMSEQRYRTVFQTSMDAIIISNLDDGTYIDVSDAFRDIMGYEPQEVIGRSSLELQTWVNPEDRRRFFETLTTTRLCRDFEARIRRKNGAIFWASIAASVIELNGRSCIFSVVRDTSESRQAEAKIAKLAYFDPLTGLANRRLLMEKLRRGGIKDGAPRRSRALLFIDLDDFKKINDTLGHQSGDRLLQITAHRLASCVRRADTVSRLGGDEFILLIEDLSATEDEARQEVSLIAAKVLESIQQPYVLEHHEWFISCSIGGCIFDDGSLEVETLLQRSDMAMYQAKAAGRNALRFFAPELQAAVKARASIEDELRKAVKEEQFEIYFQPQTEGGTIVCAEILLRWNHPSKGVIAPSEFIEVAESTGLIIPLGNWVLLSACRQLACWASRDETRHIDLAVNISAMQLRKPDFVDTVLRAIASTGANPHRLKLEITETTLLESMDEAIERMESLRAHGLRFSLDDFGTGYSSLSYLKRLPLAQVKIDRSFVRDILHDEGSAAIVRAIISLGHSMGLPVIAEGVETPQQQAYLAEMGCHAFQGYLIGLPLPLAEFEQVMSALSAGQGRFPEIAN